MSGHLPRRVLRGLLRGGITTGVRARRAVIGLAVLHFIAGSPASSCAQSVGSTAEDREFRMLVMKSGRILEGWVTHSAGGYTVDLPSGSMFVPFEQVRFEANDKGDAYRKMRRSMPELTASNHIALARWCLGNHQYPAARTELLDALSLEPNREEAREMLRRIEQQLQARDTPILEHPNSPAADSPFDSLEVKALAGLSRETADRFVLRVQPLLLNKCGNASCHGPRSNTEFRLRQARRSSRMIAEQNLAQVMQLIDRQNPQFSPLIREPLGNHGRSGRAIFFGRSGQRQIEDLKQWIASVVREERQAEQIELARQQRSNRRVQPDPSHRSSASTASVQQSTSAIGNGRPLPQQQQQQFNSAATDPTMPARDRGRELIDQVLNSAADPFSPEAFNQRLLLSAPSGTTTGTVGVTPTETSFGPTQTNGRTVAKPSQFPPVGSPPTSSQRRSTGSDRRQSANRPSGVLPQGDVRPQRSVLPLGSGYPFPLFPNRQTSLQQ